MERSCEGRDEEEMMRDKCGNSEEGKGRRAGGIAIDKPRGEKLKNE